MTKKQLVKSLGIVLGIVFVYVFASICVDIYSKQPVSFFGYSVTYVPTPSMEDTIAEKSYVLIVQVDPDDVKIGDIIVYKSKADDTKGMYIIHRIIRQEGNGYVCKGDNNIAEDTERITDDMIYGKYVKTLPVLSTILGGQNRNIMFIIIIVVFVFIFIAQMVNVYVTFKREQQKEANKEKINKLKKEIYLEELKKLIVEEMNENEE